MIGIWTPQGALFSGAYPKRQKANVCRRTWKGNPVSPGPGFVTFPDRGWQCR